MVNDKVFQMVGAATEKDLAAAASIWLERGTHRSLASDERSDRGGT